MLAPQQPAVSGGQRETSSEICFINSSAADRTYPAPTQYCSTPASTWPNMPCNLSHDHPAGRAKFGDVIGQMFVRRHRRYFRKGIVVWQHLRITQQPYRFCASQKYAYPSNRHKAVSRSRPLPPRAIRPSSRRHSASTCPSIKRFIVTREFHDIQAKHFFIRQYHNQLPTECQTISSRARLRTLESTVSTDKARASTMLGRYAARESKESYFTFTRRRISWVSGQYPAGFSNKRQRPFRPR